MNNYLQNIQSNNKNNNNKNQNQQPKQQQHQQPPVLNTLNDYLNYSFQLYQEGYNLNQEYIYESAFEKFTESEKYLNHVYPYANDTQIKKNIEDFLETLKKEKNKVNFQIQNRFIMRKEAGRTNPYEVLKEKKEIAYVINESVNMPKESIILTKSPNTQINLNKNIDINNSNNTKNNFINSNINNINSNSNNEIHNKKSENKGIVPNDIREKILGEILDNNPGITFDEVIGLDNVKQILKEIIILPNLRPDLFTGLRAPPKGLLLFGPPGTGKTLIAKAVATECKCTFFSISASALTSKYVGESEKLVRALFDIAYEKQPSVVFIDEIESILSKRNEGENEASKRLKTEFLIQFDGVGSNQEGKVLIIGATNRPFDLDTAVLRRLPKRVLIPPFNEDERFIYLKHVFKNNENCITEGEFKIISSMTNGYSNSDLKELCREAAYEPIREITDLKELENLGKLRELCYNDLFKAIKNVRGTLGPKVLDELNEWNKEYGALL
jgi:SpoVK/Ycf46/Vps4 family AAA+-type ATPase